MATCTFFGHRHISARIDHLLYESLALLINEKDVDNFLVGNEGQFDRMVQRVLARLKSEYPHTNYCIVLAYLNSKIKPSAESIYPEGLEKVPLRFTIPKRNEWMINRADYVVAYVSYTFGGSGKALEIAQRKKKTVINLADKKP